MNAPTNEKPTREAVSTASVLRLLMDRARLTPDELEWLTDAPGQAEFMLSTLERTIEGVGCLIASDGSHPCAAGDFQSSSDVPDLLFHLADVVGTARALLRVGRDAGSYLKHPETYRRAG